MFSKETCLFRQGRRGLSILRVWKVVRNFLLVPNYSQFMWKSKVIWFLWKTYWFVKQSEHSCRDTKPGSTSEEWFLWFGKSQEVGWCGELDVQCTAWLGILLGLSSATSVLRPGDLVFSVWQTPSATSGSRNVGAWLVANTFAALPCFLAGCDTPTASKRPDSC